MRLKLGELVVTEEVSERVFFLRMWESDQVREKRAERESRGCKWGRVGGTRKAGGRGRREGRECKRDRRRRGGVGGKVGGRGSKEGSNLTVSVH